MKIYFSTKIKLIATIFHLMQILLRFYFIFLLFFLIALLLNVYTSGSGEKAFCRENLKITGRMPVFKGKLLLFRVLQLPVFYLVSKHLRRLIRSLYDT